MRKTKITVSVMVISLAAFQLAQPRAPRAVLPGDGQMTDFVSVPERVNLLLRQACYDCHSAETRWPWYARISPASWYIVHDVQHGRSNLDFSNWSTNPDREPTPEQRLRWICRDIREGVMPPSLYRLVHPETRLSDADKDLICAWTDNALRQVIDGTSASRRGLRP